LEEVEENQHENQRVQNEKEYDTVPVHEQKKNKEEK
jgi:hypothetical protein